MMGVSNGAATLGSNPKVSWCLLLVLCLGIAQPTGAMSRECGKERSWEQNREDIVNVNLAGIGIVTAWGVAQWDYFSNSPKMGSEGWFGNSTDEGGADKLGHMYSTYVTAHGLSYLYETWCIKQEDAALYGALSSFAIMGYMEVGDSFSSYGFSKEDFIANSLGSLLGYYTYLSPELGDKIDMRMEYGLEPNSSDVSTDYENTKYLFALKLNGFDAFRDSFLKHVELQAGYYVRGFDDSLETRERNLFYGVGINLTDLFRRHSYNRTSTLLKYVQVPGTNVEFVRDLNE
ncbi:MAG: DUF2279 domain-containing protein [Pseudomonadota bacterium]